MSCQPSPTVAQRNATVLQRIQAFKADHPLRGYRRIWTQRHFREGLSINKKRVRDSCASRGGREGQSPIEGESDPDAQQAPTHGPESVLGH